MLAPMIVLAALSWATPLVTPAALRITPPTMMCTPQTPALTALIDEALKITVETGADEERKSLVETTVIAWVPSERQRLSDEISDLLSQRADSVQKEAIKRHERGEDVSDASATLQTLVDMVVQIKLLVKRLREVADD